MEYLAVVAVLLVFLACYQANLNNRVQDFLQQVSGGLEVTLVEGGFLVGDDFIPHSYARKLYRKLK